MADQALSSRPRMKGFRIGMWHGKQLLPGDPREYKIQRDMYQIGSAILKFGKGDQGERRVRFAGYEVPLRMRRERMDLVAYDSDFNVYIVEVKRSENTEPLDQVVEQVEGYSDLFEEIRPHFEREFTDAFFLPGVTLGKVVTVICAPRQYYLAGRCSDNSTNLKFAKRYKGVVWLGYLANIDKGKEGGLLDIYTNRPLRINFYNNATVKGQARGLCAHSAAKSQGGG